MDIKSIGKIISDTPDFEVSKATEQPASAGGISDIADGVEIAADAQQPNLFAADLKTFDPNKRYTGVLMQEGRVQTDADFNEQDATNLQLEDGVVIEFKSGDMRNSFVTGDLWDSNDRPPDQKTSSTDDSRSRAVVSDPDDKP
jgi:hypothetical protein